MEDITHTLPLNPSKGQASSKYNKGASSDPQKKFMSRLIKSVELIKAQ